MFSKKLFLPAMGFGLFCVFSLFQNACTKEHVTRNPVCFETEVRPIVTQKCMGSGCHNSVDREKDRDYSTLQGILQDVEPGNFKGSKFYEVIVKTSGEEAMPPKPDERLTAAEIRTIAIWIEEGAADNTCATSSCDTARVMSFATDVFPILQSNCTATDCHSGRQPGGNISYKNYAGTKPSALNGQLVGSIQHESGWPEMPKGAAKLSGCNIAKIKKWVDAGAPNN